MLKLGPIVLPAAPLLLLAAVFVASFLAKRLDQKHHADIERMLWRVAIAGVILARVAFVAAYFDTYRSSLWKVIDIRDGGFSLAAGVAGVLAAMAWFLARKPWARKPLLLSFLAGGALWVTGLVLTAPPSRDATLLPAMELMSLDGAPVALNELRGKPLVVNMWASWCPPCRREMPVLRDAQQQHPDVVFVFANQGESADTVRRYLESQQLTLKNVLLDPRQELSARTGFQGLPTTLFFNAQGIFVDHRMGELSAATLAQRLDMLRGAGQDASK